MELTDTEVSCKFGGGVSGEYNVKFRNPKGYSLPLTNFKLGVRVNDVSPQ